MSQSSNYRILKFNEVICENDEYDSCRDNWRDDAKWKKVPEHMIGRLTPDPRYPAHTLYRRLKT